MNGDFNNVNENCARNLNQISENANAHLPADLAKLIAKDHLRSIFNLLKQYGKMFLLSLRKNLWISVPLVYGIHRLDGHAERFHQHAVRGHDHADRFHQHAERFHQHAERFHQHADRIHEHANRFYNLFFWTSFGGCFFFSIGGLFAVYLNLFKEK
jgi:hypothetical protein